VINVVVSQQRKAMLLGAPRVIAYVDPRAPGLYTVDGFFPVWHVPRFGL
jgi:hypothetical protein